ncbi:MAG: diiron oxygenase [Labilithrix sp.]|nr:diiron oxygenase [Labilithrix sp.]
MSPPSRRIPWDDPAVSALTPELRAGLATYWEARARSELRVSEAFRLLGEELAVVGVSAVVRDMIDRAVTDEVRHAELCRTLAATYAGRAVAPTRVTPVSLPPFEGATPELRAALHVLALSCVNETIASSWLARCLQISRAPLARAVNRVHLREEVGHARLGWAHLASRNVTMQVRDKLGKWLRRILTANVPLWFTPDASLPEEGVPHHGVPSRSETRRVVLDAVRDVVLPGVAEVGVDPRSGHAWLADQER